MIAKTQSLKHILRSQQFTVSFLESLFTRTDQLRTLFENGGRGTVKQLLSGRLMYYLFWESSTRTRFSFTTAARHMGMEVEGTENAGEFSSAVKGETLEDTIRVLSSYAPDVIVMRHKEMGAADRASKISSAPIINAGDGRGQHPTQALLDLYTIKRELGIIGHKKVVIGGDLRRGRTGRSVVYLLAKYPGIRFYFLSPESLRMEDDIKEYLREKHIPYEEHTTVKQSLQIADVVYWTRVQQEREEEGLLELTEREVMEFTLDKEQLSWLPKQTVLLHPLPRVREVSIQVDADPRACYFRQAENGMFVRMALLEWILAPVF